MADGASSSGTPSKTLYGGAAKTDLVGGVNNDFTNQPPGGTSTGCPAPNIPPLVDQVAKMAPQIPKLIGKISSTFTPPGVLQQQTPTADTPKPPLQGQVSDTTPPILDVSIPPWVWPWNWQWLPPAGAAEVPKTDQTSDKPKDPKKGGTQAQPKDPPAGTNLKTQVPKEDTKKDPDPVWVKKGGTGPLLSGTTTIDACPAWKDMLSGKPPVYTPAMKDIVIGATRAEGGSPDSVQGYDDQALTFGSMQKTWTVESGGELPAQLWRFQQQENAISAKFPAHVNQFNLLFGNSGFLVTKQNLNADGTLKTVLADDGKTRVPDLGSIRMYWTDPEAQVNPKTGPVYMTGAQFKKYLRKMEKTETHSWAPILAPFQTAGQSAAFQSFQLRDLANRLNSVLKESTNDYTVAEWAQGAEFQSQLLQLSLNRPNNVTNKGGFKDTPKAKYYNDLGDALNLFFENNPTADRNPNNWTDAQRKTYEPEIMKDLVTMEQRGGHVTTPQTRFDKTHEYFTALAAQRAKAAQAQKKK